MRTLSPTPFKRLKPIKRTNSHASDNTFLSAYPNPSNGPVYLVYTIPDGVEDAVVRMVDSGGRVVLDRGLGTRDGIVELNTRAHASGLYVAVLYFDGIQVSATKVNVMR